jgi:adenine-specific DNA-methyltransferase
MAEKNTLGQYFTTNIKLKDKVLEFMLNKSVDILEPSIGRGDLIKHVLDKRPYVKFDMYEIDSTIEMIETIDKDKIIYKDFIKEHLTKKYKTIIGNPPYIRTKKGNLYIDFIDKCYNLLEDDGELIFIIPSDFFKLTCASKLLNDMMLNGSFTHIYHPHDENMFENASIDILIFRYYKNKLIEKKVIYNDKILHIVNGDGLITFVEEKNNSKIMFKDYFDIYVGIVSGKDSVYKNNKLGNIDVINGEDKIEKYIYLKKFPCENDEITNHLLRFKNELINRKIRKFNEDNWFEWGVQLVALNLIFLYKNKDLLYIITCIYIYISLCQNNILKKIQI